ncbi:hypothetical protein BRC87_01320 [Halobacteriales archaeon QS_4_66_20]|nr:MAG: hypothetical protein BRC87_01320 [Halobacteriales archaeon QS_4_66_20]
MTRDIEHSGSAWGDSSDRRVSRREALGGIAGLGLAALGPAVQPTAASQDEAVAVSVRPGERSVEPGTEATFDVVVEDAVNGISAVSAELSASDADVATPTDVELTKETSLSDAEFSDGAVTVKAAMGDNTFDPAAEIVPMTVTVETQSPGTTELRIDTATFTDADNETYAVGQTTDATVTVDSGDERSGDDGEEQSDGSAGDSEDGADDGTDGEANGGEQGSNESTENGDESAENGGDESVDGGNSDENDGANGGGGEGSGGTPTDGTDDGENSSENGSAADNQGESSQDDDGGGDGGEATSDDGDSTNETTADDDSADDDSTDETTADDDGPGFGIATGLASLGALGYGLLRRGSSTERDEQ